MRREDKCNIKLNSLIWLIPGKADVCWCNRKTTGCYDKKTTPGVASKPFAIWFRLAVKTRPRLGA